MREDEEAVWTNNRRGRGCGEPDQSRPLCVYLGRIVVCLLFPPRVQWCSRRGFAVFFREELRAESTDHAVPFVSRGTRVRFSVSSAVIGTRVFHALCVLFAGKLNSVNVSPKMYTSLKYSLVLIRFLPVFNRFVFCVNLNTRS